MLALLLVILALAGYVAYDAGKAVRRALEARPRDRHGLLRRRPRYDDHARIHARDYAPTRDRSLDVSSPVCEHPGRPVAVVVTRDSTPVGWLCPVCLADRPEPPALGPVREPVAAPRITPGTITADRITAGTITLGPSLADERDAVKQALHAARERVREAADQITIDGNGTVTLTRADYEAFIAAMEEEKDLRAMLAATPEPLPERDVYEVRSHQSATPVGTFTDQIVAAFDVPPALLGSPGTYANAAADLRRSNLIALLREAGHSPAYIAEYLAEWDRRQTTAHPVRIHDPRPSPGWTLPY